MQDGDGGRAWTPPAGSILVALPMILVFLLLQRHFIAGLTLGAGKG